MLAQKFQWPSIQRDSEILRRRIQAELHVRDLRELLEQQFERKAA